jgi:hypothetical protein
MKIYSCTGYGNGAVFVTPGTHYPTNTDWMSEGEDGKRKPIQFTVQFRAGVTDVPESLGRYMIAQKLAYASPQKIAAPSTLQAFEDLIPKYRTPIAVGRPLFEVSRDHQ